MKAIVDMQLLEGIVLSVTAAYSDLIKSLKQAVRYYTKCSGCTYEDARILAIEESISILTGRMMRYNCESMGNSIRANRKQH